MSYFQLLKRLMILLGSFILATLLFHYFFTAGAMFTSFIAIKAFGVTNTSAWMVDSWVRKEYKDEYIIGVNVLQEIINNLIILILTARSLDFCFPFQQRKGHPNEE